MLVKAIQPDMQLRAHADLVEAQRDINQPADEHQAGEFADISQIADVKPAQQIGNAPFKAGIDRIIQAGTDGFAITNQTKQRRETVNAYGKIEPRETESQNAFG